MTALPAHLQGIRRIVMDEAVAHTPIARRVRDKLPHLTPQTLAEGESYDDLLADASAFEDFQAGAYYNGKGFGFVRLQQLATEHLLGAR